MFVVLFTTQLLVSCDLTEECIYYGKLDVSVDWSQVQQTRSASQVSMLLLPLTGEGTKSGTISESINSTDYQKDLQIGNYEIYVYNETTLKPKESADRELSLEATTMLRENKMYIATDITPVYVSADKEVTIKHEKTTSLNVVPSVFLQELQFRVSIKNRVKSEIVSVEAVLDGLSTGKYLKSKKVTNGYASQEFTPIKGEEKNLYSTGFYTLGINPEVPNILTLKVSFKDAHQLETKLNLSQRLKSFVASKAVIDIDVETGELFTTAIIKDWEEVDWGNL